jgi:sugar lactone lactonase YvrE
MVQQSSVALLCLLMISIFPKFITASRFDRSPLQAPIRSAVAAAPVRGVLGDDSADIVLGKPYFGEMVPNEVTGSRVFNPGGVIIDRSVTPNRMYVYDGGNSRVLGVVLTSTVDLNGRRADLVLGQPGLDGYGACNGDGNFQNYPDRAPASASTLCSMPEYQISPREGGSFANMAVDSQGNLYVPDFDNHRVLLYLSPFTTDRVADAVWGQANFADNACNRAATPGANTLCLRSVTNEGFVGGVGLDSAGNLWVTDNQNNRVLRFPYDSGAGRPATTADLVLGQPNFTSNQRGSALNRMSAPAGVRVAAGGRVYVADSLNNRVLIFEPPIVTGMSASRTLGSGLRLPTSIEFDLSGDVWVSDSGNNQLLRFDGSEAVDRVLFKDLPDYSGQCGGPYSGDGPQFSFPGTGVVQDSYNVCDSRGSIGIDSAGNLFVTGSTFVQDVWRFPAPFPTMTPGTAHSADRQVFKPYTIGQVNAVTAKSLGDPRGVATNGDQLVVADAGRILFWNNAPASLTNGKAADGVVGPSNFNAEFSPPFGELQVDNQNHLWTMRVNTISVYTLPLTTGQTPFYSLQPPASVAGGGSIGWTSILDIAGIAVSASGDYLWLADPENNRVLRIRNPLTNPLVDVVLGQLNATGNQCNRGAAQPSQTSLCRPGNVAFDRNGNLFVSDHALEVTGNHRMLEYDAALFPAAPASALFAVPANRVYGTNGSFTGSACQDLMCGPWDPAFSSSGRMVVGMNTYLGSHFPVFYQDPLNNSSPGGTLNDYYSMAYATHYDAAGNLYITDRNRGRVLIYLAESRLYLPVVMR